MMWAAILALLTYLLSPRDSSTERKQALLKAAAVGGITYGVAEYTDWGKENLKPLDNTVSGWFSGGGTTTGAGGKKDDKVITTGSGGGGAGVWETIKSWGPAALGAVGVSSAASKIPTWVWLTAAGVGIYLVVKD